MKRTNNTVTLAFAVDKGGTGKTTTCLNTAAGLAARGFAVLAVDTDQQANMTRTLLREPPETHLHESLLDDSRPLAVVHVRPNLDLIPSSSHLFGIGFKMVSLHEKQKAAGVEATDYRLVLQRLLRDIKRNYDYVLIDCPPSDNVMLFNALFAADSVIIVANPEPYCVEGVRNYCQIIRAIRTSGHQLGLIGVLIARYDPYSKNHVQAAEAIKAQLPHHTFRTCIRHSRYVYRAVLEHADIFSFAPGSNPARDYDGFIEELINKTQK